MQMRMKSFDFKVLTRYVQRLIGFFYSYLLFGSKSYVRSSFTTNGTANNLNKTELDLKMLEHIFSAHDR